VNRKKCWEDTPPTPVDIDKTDGVKEGTGIERSHARLSGQRGKLTWGEEGKTPRETYGRTWWGKKRGSEKPN